MPSLRIGDRVWLEDLNQDGYLIGLPVEASARDEGDPYFTVRLAHGGSVLAEGDELEAACKFCGLPLNASAYCEGCSHDADGICDCEGCAALNGADE